MSNRNDFILVSGLVLCLIANLVSAASYPPNIDCSPDGLSSISYSVAAYADKVIIEKIRTNN